MKANMFIETRDVLAKGDRKAYIDKNVWHKVSLELSEYTGSDIRTIACEFWKDKAALDKNEEEAIEKDPNGERINAYYKDTKRYLYECTCWEAYKSKQRDFKKIFLTLRKFGVSNILDFGGGTGGLILYLSKRGIKCDYLDVEGETSNFTRWRFKRNNLDIGIKKDIKDCPYDFYDAVISDNVFEHLLDLEDIVKGINRSLHTGGFLIARSSFGGGGSHLRKNDQYSQFDVYDRLMTDKGLSYCGQLKEDPITREINKYVKNYWILSIYLRKRRKYGGNFLIYRKLHKKKK